jgi:hypothetical protein
MEWRASLGAARGVLSVETTNRRHIPSMRSLPRMFHYAVTRPAEAWVRLREHHAARRERRGSQCFYEPAADWEPRLHELLGLPWPCPATEEFWTLWPAVIEPLTAKGLRIGVGFFAGWNDGDPAMVRAAWCLTRHLRPLQVVETGVGRGITSRFILEGLERNGAGHLWSVDLPQLLDPALNEEVGAAVERRLHRRWSYIKGSSRRRLPGLLASLGQIDLFVHDSRHTEYNVLFELGEAWSRLRPGGAVLVDDIDLNWAFHFFTRPLLHQSSLICRAEPLQPDPRRTDGRGLFGIVRKPSPETR